jgi:hypothetical protein
MYLHVSFTRYTTLARCISQLCRSGGPPSCVFVDQTPHFWNFLWISQFMLGPWSPFHHLVSWFYRWSNLDFFLAMRSSSIAFCTQASHMLLLLLWKKPKVPQVLAIASGHTVSARELRIHAEEAKGLFIKAGQAGDVDGLTKAVNDTVFW